MHLTRSPGYHLLSGLRIPIKMLQMFRRIRKARVYRERNDKLDYKNGDKSLRSLSNQLHALGEFAPVKCYH